MSKTVNQHYVPQFLLNKFCSSEQKKIYVFDKTVSKSFCTNIRNIAAEREFYNFSRDGIEFSLESSISNVESATKSILDEIINAGSLTVLNEDKCATLSLFMAIQFFRGPRVREDHKTIAQALREKFGQTEEAKAMLNREFPYGDDHAKNFAIYFLANDAHKFMHHFLNKTWLLFEAPSNAPFCVSDNPIVMHNTNNFKPYGNLGLASPGIEITFPICPKYALGFNCLSIEAEFRKGIENYTQLQKDNDEFGLQFSDAIKTAKEYIFAAEHGSPVILNTENILHFNSLQIGFANRFVFSLSDNFDLAQDMVAKRQTNWSRLKFD